MVVGAAVPEPTPLQPVLGCQCASLTDSVADDVAFEYSSQASQKPPFPSGWIEEPCE